MVSIDELWRIARSHFTSSYITRGQCELATRLESVDVCQIPLRARSAMPSAQHEEPRAECGRDGLLDQLPECPAGAEQALALAATCAPAVRVCFDEWAS